MIVICSMNDRILMSHIHSKERLIIKKGSLTYWLCYNMDWRGDECLHPCVSVCNSNMVVPSWPPRFISWAWEKLGTCAVIGMIILFLERQLCGRVLWCPRGRYKDRLASQGLFTVSTGSWDIREAGSGLTCFTGLRLVKSCQEAFS